MTDAFTEHIRKAHKPRQRTEDVNETQRIAREATKKP
jgi:hypothetical protein